MFGSWMVQFADCQNLKRNKPKNLQSEVDVGVGERWCRRKNIMVGRRNCSAGRVWCFQGDAQRLCGQSYQHTLTVKCFRVHYVSFLCLGYHFILPGADQEQSINMVRKSLSAPLQVRTQVNPISCYKQCRVIAVELL